MTFTGRKKVTTRILAVLFLLTTGPVAADSSPDIPIRYTHYQIDYRLNDDSSHEETYRWEKKVLKERAVEEAKETSISYSTSIQKADVIEAFTRKGDGRRIDVPKNNFQVKVNKGRDEDAPVFSDYTTLTVVFPDVAVGDTLVLAYKIVQTEPMFPRQFSEYATFPRVYAFDDVRIRVDYPNTLWAQYEARQMNERVTEKNGRKIIEWTYANPNPIKSERRDFSVYDKEKDPGYAFSTFRSYAEITEAYGARATPKSAITDRIQNLADEITAGKTTPRDQARALYDWVATHITYAGNCIGVGAVVPHDTDFILDNRMGDCKDHSTLLQALLAAKGIESIQALVNAGSAYKLPKIPVVSHVNHVINYIPDFDVYVDSTAATVPFGMLPFRVADKPVLWVEGHRDGTRTPATAIGDNQQHMKTVIKLLADGSASGQAEVSQKGMFSLDTRSWKRRLSKEDEEKVVENWFRRQGWIGSGAIELADATELRADYAYKVQFDRKNFVQRPGAGGFHIEPVIFSDAPIMRFAYAAVEPVESTEIACSSGSSTEEYVYEFPDDIKILAIPDDLTIADAALSYSARYQLKGNTLTVKRVFEDRTKGNVCSPESTKAYQAFAKKVMADVKAQVVYK